MGPPRVKHNRERLSTHTVCYQVLIEKKSRVRGAGMSDKELGCGVRFLIGWFQRAFRKGDIRAKSQHFSESAMWMLFGKSFPARVKSRTAPVQ